MIRLAALLAIIAIAACSPITRTPNSVNDVLKPHEVMPGPVNR